MTKKKPLPLHSVIVDFWKDKCITRQGKVVSFTDITPAETIPVVEEEDVPQCWGCGEVIFEYDEWPETGNPWVDKLTRHKLDRCHIIPEVCGGENKPPNLFLLCHRCHRASPDTTNAAAFLRWVFDRRENFVWGLQSLGSLLSEIDEELARRDLPPFFEILKRVPKEDAPRVNQMATAERAKDYLRKNVGMHSFTVVHQSIVIAGTDFLLEVLKDYVPELEGEHKESVSLADERCEKLMNKTCVKPSVSRRSRTGIKVWTIDGETKSVSKWCKQYGVSYTTAITRVEKLGLTPIQALTFPGKQRRDPIGYFKSLGLLPEDWQPEVTPSH